MTILEVIQKSAAYLERKGVPAARLQGELLLAHVLERPRLRLYLDFDQPVPEPALARLRELVRRRGQREPLQHLVGTVAFADFEVLAGPQALIPRPETELLLERACACLRARLAGPGAPEHPAVLDWGTGTGCLAIGLARQFPQAALTAVDIAPEALELARRNAEKNGVAGRIAFVLSDGFSGLAAGRVFEVVVANPPYIPTEEIAVLDPEVRDHDPRLALDGGPDGLSCYRRLAAEGAAYLSPPGTLLIELGHGQAAAVAAVFGAHQWEVVSVERDYQGIERVMTLRRRRPS